MRNPSLGHQNEAGRLSGDSGVAVVVGGGGVLRAGGRIAREHVLSPLSVSALSLSLLPDCDAPLKDLCGAASADHGLSDC